MTELSNELLQKINRHDPDFLYRLLENTIGLYLEYTRTHGQSENNAKNSAITEVLQSLDYLE